MSDVKLVFKRLTNVTVSSSDSRSLFCFVFCFQLQKSNILNYRRTKLSNTNETCLLLLGLCD